MKDKINSTTLTIYPDIIDHAITLGDLKMMITELEQTEKTINDNTKIVVKLRTGISENSYVSFPLSNGLDIDTFGFNKEKVITIE